MFDAAPIVDEILPLCGLSAENCKNQVVPQGGRFLERELPTVTWRASSGSHHQRSGFASIQSLA